MADDMTIKPLLITAEVLAKLLQISRAQIFRMKSFGRLPLPIRLGKSLRWDLDEIRKWIAAKCPSVEHWETMKKIDSKKVRRSKRPPKDIEDESSVTFLHYGLGFMGFQQGRTWAN